MRGAGCGDRALDLGRAALLDVGEHVVRLCGITASNVVPVSTRSPPITIGMWTRSADISASRFWSSARSGDPGA